MRRALALALGLSLACKRPEVPPRVVRVEVPVPVPCLEPPIVERPRLPIADLKPDTPQAEANRMVAASIELLMGYAKQLEATLQGYRKPKPKPTPEGGK